MQLLLQKTYHGMIWCIVFSPKSRMIHEGHIWSTYYMSVSATVFFWWDKIPTQMGSADMHFSCLDLLGFTFHRIAWNDVWKLVTQRIAISLFVFVKCWYQNCSLWNRRLPYQSWDSTPFESPRLSISGTWSKAVRVVQLKRIRKQDGQLKKGIQHGLILFMWADFSAVFLRQRMLS